MDAKTVFIMMAALSLVLGVVVLFAGRRQSLRASKYWAAGYGLIIASVGLAAIRGRAPAYLTVALANTVSVLALAVFLEGVTKLQESRPRPFLIYAFPAVVFLAMQFIYDSPEHFWARSLLMASVLTLQSAHAVALLVGRSPRNREEFFIAFFFGLVGLASLARLGARSLFPRQNVLLFDWLDGTYFLVIVVCLVGLGMGFLLIANRHLNADVERLAYLDPLTEIFNRRAFLAEAHREVSRCERKERPYSILMCDLDRFKSLNDRFGHEAGDAVLRAFAGALRSHLRETDVYGRFGGEEFCILLPETEIVQAAFVAERLRKAFQALSVKVNGKKIAGTVSIGVSEAANAADTEFPVVMRRADLALYAAKAGGRNTVKSA